LLTLNGGLELGEIVQNLSHLVTTLTTSDVNNTVRVGVLGKSLGNASLTATESSGNGTSTTLDSGEEGIEDTLTSSEGVVTRKLFGDGSWVTHGPEVRHFDFVLSLGVFNNSDWLSHVVHTLRHHFDDSTADLGGGHDTVLREQVILENSTKDIATNDELTGLEVFGGELPFFDLIEGGDINTTWHED
jgi:hypothetical protein